MIRLKLERTYRIDGIHCELAVKIFSTDNLLTEEIGCFGEKIKWKTHISIILIVKCFRFILHSNAVADDFDVENRITFWINSYFIAQRSTIKYLRDLEKLQQKIWSTSLCYHRYDNNERCCRQHSLSCFGHGVSNGQRKRHGSTQSSEK